MLVRSSLLSGTEFCLRPPSRFTWENKVGASHVTSESNVKKLPSTSRDMNKWISTMATSWCLELHCQTDGLDPLSQAERSLAYIGVVDINTTISNSTGKNATVCDCGWNVCHSTHGTSPQDETEKSIYFMTQVLQTQCTLHAWNPCTGCLNLLWQCIHY